MARKNFAAGSSVTNSIRDSGQHISPIGKYLHQCLICDADYLERRYIVIAKLKYATVKRRAGPESGDIVMQRIEEMAIPVEPHVVSLECGRHAFAVMSTSQTTLTS